MKLYLDHAAATPIDPDVRRAVSGAMDIVGNPSSYNDAGRRTADVLLKARTTIAHFLNAHSQEIIFTASGSEANALVVRNFKNILTTPIEHKSVLENSVHAAYLCVDAQGRVDLDDVVKKLTKNTEVVSVMYANNEIGTIEPITKIAKLIKSFRQKNRSAYPLFHVDACQAAGYLDMDVQRLGVDLLTFNGSKIYGPRGIGVLYVRRGVKLVPIVRGGGQERGLRAGTENVPAIVGLAEALTIQDSRFKIQESKRIATLRDHFFKKLPTLLPEVCINGALGNQRLPNNINISIPGLDSENLLLELDKHGIWAGSGSACTARSVEPSHVLKAIGVRKPYLTGALRFSLGRETKKRDIDHLLKVVPQVVRALKKRYS